MLNTWGFREREREIIFTFFIVFPLLSFLRSSNLSLYLSLCCLVYDYQIKKEKISKTVSIRTTLIFLFSDKLKKPFFLK